MYTKNSYNTCIENIKCKFIFLSCELVSAVVAHLQELSRFLSLKILRSNRATARSNGGLETQPSTVRSDVWQLWHIRMFPCINRKKNGFGENAFVELDGPGKDG